MSSPCAWVLELLPVRVLMASLFPRDGWCGGGDDGESVSLSNLLTGLVVCYSDSQC